MPDSPDTDDSAGRVWPGGSHQDTLGGASLAETTRRALEQNRQWSLLPGNVEYEALRSEGRDLQRRQKAVGTPKGLIGPPNPYKPHRKG